MQEHSLWLVPRLSTSPKGLGTFPTPPSLLTSFLSFQLLHYCAEMYTEGSEEDLLQLPSYGVYTLMENWCGPMQVFLCPVWQCLEWPCHRTLEQLGVNQLALVNSQSSLTFVVCLFIYLHWILLFNV